MLTNRRWPVLVLVGLVSLVFTLAIGIAAVMLLFASIDFQGPPGSAWLALYIDRLGSILDQREFWILVAINLPIIAVSQFLFLLPVFRFNPELGGRKSLRLSMVVAGLGAAILTTGMLMALVSLGQLLTGTVDSFPLTLFMDAELAMGGQDLWIDQENAMPTLVAGGVLIGTWVLWSILLIGFVKRRSLPDGIRRITGLLFAGTLLEILLVLPLDAMVRRKADCQCATGSFQALLAAAAAGTWLLGPGLLVLLMSRKPAYWGRYCPGCGHAKGPRAAQPAQCPECGRAWQVGEGPAG